MRPEQHPASNSTARKAHAEATDPHGGCKVGQCKAEDQWRTVSCAGGGGDVEAIIERALHTGVCGEAADACCWTDDEIMPCSENDLSRLAAHVVAALAAQPAAPQPTEGVTLTEAEVESRMALLSPVSIAVAEDVWTEDEPTLAEYELTERILAARSQRLEGVTVTEWASAIEDDMEPGPVLSEEQARAQVYDWNLARNRCLRDLRNPLGRAVLLRRYVTEWAEVSGDTEAGGDR